MRLKNYCYFKNKIRSEHLIGHLFLGKINIIHPWKFLDYIYLGPPKKWMHDLFYLNGKTFLWMKLNLLKYDFF